MATALPPVATRKQERMFSCRSGFSRDRMFGGFMPPVAPEGAPTIRKPDQ